MAHAHPNEKRWAPKQYMNRNETKQRQRQSETEPIITQTFSNGTFKKNWIRRRRRVPIAERVRKNALALSLTLAHSLPCSFSVVRSFIPVKWIFDCTYHHHCCLRHRYSRNVWSRCCRSLLLCSMIAVSAISLLTLLWLLYRWHYVNTRCDAWIFAVLLCREWFVVGIIHAPSSKCTVNCAVFVRACVCVFFLLFLFSIRHFYFRALFEIFISVGRCRFYSRSRNFTLRLFPAFAINAVGGGHTCYCYCLCAWVIRDRCWWIVYSFITRTHTNTLCLCAVLCNVCLPLTNGTLKYARLDFYFLKKNPVCSMYDVYKCLNAMIRYVQFEFNTKNRRSINCSKHFKRDIHYAIQEGNDI